MYLPTLVLEIYFSHYVMNDTCTYDLIITTNLTFMSNTGRVQNSD